MDISTGAAGAIADSTGYGPAVVIGTALQAQVDAAQTADISALFGSLGLGSNANALA